MGGGTRYSFEDYVEQMNAFAYNGVAYGMGVNDSGVKQTLAGQTTEAAPNNFAGLARYAYMANGPIFSCMMVRMLVFSSIRLEWQRMLQGKPSETWANDKQLRIFQRPWMNGTTQDLLVRMIQDADLAGNAYITRDGDQLVRMRPDWVDILLQPRIIRDDARPIDRNQNDVGQLGWRKVGYLYTEGGRGSGKDPVVLLPERVAHFCPIPDPLADYRGMSWITPIIQEIQADQSMTKHQRKFMDNGATPNLIVKYQPGTTLPQIQAFKEIFDEKHTGIENAYKTLHISPGADPVAVGKDFRQIDFKSVRGAGETRIAAAAGVPPIIAGFSEGLESATYSNYAQARRRFADGTMHPLWQNAAGSLETLVTLPDDANRLWYDATDIPFLREDEKDAAEIAQVEATTVNQLIVAGFEPDSVVKALLAGDWNLLVHSGLTSVQLVKPGSTTDTGNSTGSNDTNSVDTSGGTPNDNQTE